MTEIAVPGGIPTEMKEARCFFGTLERKSIVPINATREETLRQLAAEARLDDKWVVDRSFEGTQKSCPIVIARRNEDPEPRQALPIGLKSFVADHVEKWKLCESAHNSMQGRRITRSASPSCLKSIQQSDEDFRVGQ
jgi:hypothetical protein